MKAVTSNEINALPHRLRDYIHHIEANCDPAGTLRENYRLRIENAALTKRVSDLELLSAGWESETEQALKADREKPQP